MNPFVTNLSAKIRRTFLSWNSPGMAMLTRVVGLGINFFSLMLVAKVSSQELLGLIIALNGAAFLGANLLSLGLPTLLLKSMTEHFVQEDRSRLLGEFRRALFIVTGVGAAGAALGVTIALVQRAGWLPSALGSFSALDIAALAFCSACMGIQFIALSAIRACKEPSWSGVLQFCTPPLSLLLMVLPFLFKHQSMTHRDGVLALTLSISLNVVFSVGFAYRRLGRHPARELAPIPWAATRHFWFLGFLSSAAANAPVLIAAGVMSAADVALVGVPFRIANIPMTIVNAMGTYYAPLIRESFLLHSANRMRAHLTESQWMGALIVSPLILGIALFPAQLPLLFGITDPAAPRILTVFICAQFVIASCGVCTQYLSMLDREKYANVLTLGSLLGTLVVGTLMARIGGAFWLAVAWAVFSTARQLSLCITARRLGVANP